MVSDRYRCYNFLTPYSASTKPRADKGNGLASEDVYNWDILPDHDTSIEGKSFGRPTYLASWDR